MKKFLPEQEGDSNSKLLGFGWVPFLRTDGWGFHSEGLPTIEILADRRCL